MYILYLFPERVSDQHILTVMLIIAFAFGGIIEQSSSVALMPQKNTFASDEEFAKYIENTSYINRLCNRPENDTQFNLHVVSSIPHVEVCIIIMDKFLPATFSNVSVEPPTHL